MATTDSGSGPKDAATAGAAKLGTEEPVADVKVDGLKVVVNAHVHFKINLGNYESADAGLSLTVETAQSKGAADRALAGIRTWLKVNAPSIIEDAVALHKKQQR